MDLQLAGTVYVSLVVQKASEMDKVNIRVEMTHFGGSTTLGDDLRG